MLYCLKTYCHKMDVSIRNKLMEEYVKNLIHIFRILEITGFCRFVIRKGRIVERNLGSKLYNVFVLIYSNASAVYLLLFEHYLISVEYIAIWYFTTFANLIICHVTFSNKYAGLELMLNNIEIDVLLGAEETAFMRQVSITFFRIIVATIAATQLVDGLYMIIVFNVSIVIHVVGSLHFYWLFYSYCEFCFMMYLFSFLTTRIRFLNVALMKTTKINMDYIPKQHMFHMLFWKDEFDERVTFHTRSDNKDFCVALKMCFNQLRRIESCYRFTIFLCVVTIAVGSIVAVQIFIMCIKTEDTPVVRAIGILMWSGASWFHLFSISLLSDLFFRQIEQTKLICAFIQLKPNTSADNLKLTKDILKILEVRDANISVYGMFSFDTGLVLTMAASTFVYITVQLQLAFPNLKDVHKVQNVTFTPIEFDFDPAKVKEYWFL